MRTVVILTLLAAVAMLLTGCEDKSTNYNYYNLPELSTVSGTVSPADSGTVTIIGDTVLHASIKGDGFFMVDSVPPGLYSVTIDPAHYSKRLISRLLVAKSSDYLLRGIALSNYPYPISSTSPAHGYVGQNISGEIRLYADEPLNLQDLTQLATFDPPLYGVWTETANRGYSNLDGDAMYAFTNRVAGQPSPDRSMMQLGTTYLATIPGSVRTAAGVPLGSALYFSFTTQPLTVNVRLYFEGLERTMPISDPRIILEFPICVNKDSLNRAVSFVPDAPGLWLPIDKPYAIENCSDLNNYRSYRYYPTSLLRPDTEYLLIVSDQVLLVEHSRLALPDTTRFVTESYGVASTYPENSAFDVPPTCTLLVRFNTAMDTASVRSAFELHEYGGAAVTGTTSWPDNRTMSFAPDLVLMSGSLYRLAVAETAKSAAGNYLKADYVSYFVTM